MLPQDLDYFFPFFVCLYGIVMLLALNSPTLVNIAKLHLPKDHFDQFYSRIWLGWACLVIGGIWSFQNLLSG